MLKTLSLVLVIFCVLDEGFGLSVRFVSWNVLDNSWMDGKYNQQAVQELMGPIHDGHTTFPTQDVYAVSVQENCYKCNEGSKEKLADVFLKELQRYGSYSLVGISMTRNSGICEIYACFTGQHGTTAIFVFARNKTLTYTGSVHKNECDSNFIHNAEKGIAGVKTMTKNGSKSLCFSGLHLDKNSASAREECIRKFTKYANRDLSWNTCDVAIMGGDFNVRSGLDPETKSGAYPWHYYEKEYLEKLRDFDEFNGNLSKTFLNYINMESGFHYVEAKLNFLPTYSILQSEKCNYVEPCYSGSKTPGWTDRIICSGCRQTKFYNSSLFGLSDHDPVIAIYEV